MNNKGFMLVETIVVSSVLIATMVSLYTGYNKLYIQYQKRANYYDIDLVYAGKAIMNYLIGNNTISDISSSTETIDLSQIYNSPFVNTIKEELDIDDMILVATDTMTSYSDDDEGMNEYVTYLKKHLTEDELNNNQYILLMSRKDNNQYKYGYLKIA